VYHEELARRRRLHAETIAIQSELAVDGIPPKKTCRGAMKITPEYESYMRETWPKALAKLKTLCETH
ncbi:MAG TPA: hypothetical protein VNM87_13045, partial [Candidatus Udaeobacter sp.]|nr:hypothetical protein [Candidatus Udaeobacter sp.]